MDVMLLKDVEKLGTEGAVVHVKPGFARNYLLPQGLAVHAGDAQLRTVAELKRQRTRKLARIRTQAEAMKRKIEALKLTLKLTLGEHNQPFGSITAHDVAEALGRHGLSVEKHAIQLEQPIKVLGMVEIPMRLQADVTATLRLLVSKG